MAAAASLAARIGVADSRWVTSNVYDAAEALDGEQFDIVYTGKGALCWLPDIERWARVAASMVKPGGFLYLAEFHPFGNTLDDENGRTVAYDYFDRSPQVWDEPGTYADLEAPTRENVSVEFNHGIGEIVSALIGAGLRLEFLHEYDMTLFERFAVLEQRDGVLPAPGGDAPGAVDVLAARREAGLSDCRLQLRHEALGVDDDPGDLAFADQASVGVVGGHGEAQEPVVAVREFGGGGDGAADRGRVEVVEADAGADGGLALGQQRLGRGDRGLLGQGDEARRAEDREVAGADGPRGVGVGDVQGGLRLDRGAFGGDGGFGHA